MPDISVHIRSIRTRALRVTEANNIHGAKEYSWKECRRLVTPANTFGLQPKTAENIDDTQTKETHNKQADKQTGERDKELP